MNTDKKLLTGYDSQDNAYKVDHYPYGFTLRTSIFYWIETKLGKGDRFCSYTINPKNGKKNKPKCSTYYPFMYMYINEKGHVAYNTVNPGNLDGFAERFKFVVSDIGVENLTDIQKSNIRTAYWQAIRANAYYEALKFTEGKKAEYNEWVKGKLDHIQRCDFKDLVNYPDKPLSGNLKNVSPSDM